MQLIYICKNLNFAWPFTKHAKQNWSVSRRVNRALQSISSVLCILQLEIDNRKRNCVLRINLLTAEILHHFPCCKILTMAMCDMSPCLRLFLLVTEYPAHFPLSIILAEQREMQTVNRLKAWLAPHRWCQNVKVKTVKIKCPRWFWTFSFSEELSNRLMCWVMHLPEENGYLSLAQSQF